MTKKISTKILTFLFILSMCFGALLIGGCHHPGGPRGDEKAFITKYNTNIDNDAFVCKF